ncbi:hypothetical protein [Paraburkholderia sp. J41]|nr:hypothetical protein [Paraburkholderia sp. J41]
MSRLRPIEPIEPAPCEPPEGNPRSAMDAAAAQNAANMLPPFQSFAVD